MKRGELMAVLRDSRGDMRGGQKVLKFGYKERRWEEKCIIVDAVTNEC